jgi:hypothetical protein
VVGEISAAVGFESKQRQQIHLKVPTSCRQNVPCSFLSDIVPSFVVVDRRRRRRRRRASSSSCVVVVVRRRRRRRASSSSLSSLPKRLFVSHPTPETSG